MEGCWHRKPWSKLVKVALQVVHMLTCMLTSRYLRPVSSYKYCILPSVIMTGSLYQARIAARRETRFRRSFLTWEKFSVTKPTWIQVSLAKVDNFLLGGPSVLYRLVRKRWKFRLGGFPRRKRSLRTVLQTRQVPLRFDSISQCSCGAAHGVGNTLVMLQRHRYQIYTCRSLAA